MRYRLEAVHALSSALFRSGFCREVVSPFLPLPLPLGAGHAILSIFRHLHPKNKSFRGLYLLFQPQNDLYRIPLAL